MSLGKKIRSARVAMSMSGSDLARAIGVTPSAVSAWESDRSAPRPHLLQKIAQKLGIDLSPADEVVAEQAEKQVHAEHVGDVLSEAKSRIAVLLGCEEDDFSLDLNFSI